MRRVLAPLLAAASSCAHAQHMDHENMLMWQVAPWSIMAHGIANAVIDYQGGPRGDRMQFSNSMAMLMADRPAGESAELQLRGMLSLDPAMGPRGYPLLFQSGETADGVSHLVDRQHPHDFFMELSAAYRARPAEDIEAWVYGGLPGEAALGPQAFMHRASGERIPEAPLTHHWLDSTHVTMGVVTLGASRGALKLEASAFNGREPDQNRWDIETRGFDSWSARITYAPLEGLSMQASHGYLKSPEALDPSTSVRRTTASVSYGTDAFAVTLAWGRNDKDEHGQRRKLDGWLLEATGTPAANHTVFARLERVRNDELFEEGHPLHGEAFDIGKLSVGYIYDFAKTGTARWSVGALASAFRVPAEIRAYYDAHPPAYMGFLQVRF